ncbi:MAG: hypothetical protein ABEI80_04975 [Haloplanus sp.]
MPELNDWQQYLQTVLDEQPNVFDFSHLIEEYEKHFHKDDITILLFEQFANERMTFANQLANALGMDVETLLDAVKYDSHENKREISERYRFGRMTRSITFHRILTRYTAIPAFVDRLRDIVGTRIVDDILDVIYYEDYEIPRPTDEQEAAILDRYHDSNERLCDEFGLHREVLERYNYLRS